ncbi:MAG: polysaccharide biosynthesis protein [Lachnospiraceae bacterium]|nr:polysaccharide biosynthesis protein [Lachnospiraceae bacterium]
MAGSKPSGKNNFLLQGGILAAASLLVRFIGLLYRIPLTRIVGDEGMGYYSNAYEIYNLALLVSSYSLPIAISKLIAARESKKQYRTSYRLFLCAMVFAIVVGGIAALVVFFGANVFAEVFCKSPNSAIPLRILAPTIFVFSIMGVLRGLFQGKHTMIPTSISQVFEQIVNAVVSVWAAYELMHIHSLSEQISAYGAAGGTAGTLLGAIAGLLFLIFIFSIYRPVLKKRAAKDRTGVEESYGTLVKLIAITTIPLILSQTVYQISGIVDLSVFGHLMEGKGFSEAARSEMTGIYNNKYRQLTNLPVAIATAMGAAIMPALTAAYTNKRENEVRYKTAVSIKLNMIIAIPAAVGMALLAEPILKLLYADTNPMSINMLRLGSIAIVFFALSTITNNILQGINRMHTPVIHAGIALVLHVVLLIIMIEVMNLGAYALVIGNVTFALTVCLLNAIALARHLNYRQEMLHTFIIPAISALIMGVVTFGSYKVCDILLGSTIISTAVSFVASVVVYFAALILLRGVDEDELYSLPMGGRIVRLAKKLHLMR